MSYFRFSALVAAFVASVVNDPLMANPVVVGMGVEADNADSRAYSLFADIGLSRNTWLSGSVARTDTDGPLFDVSTRYAEIGLDHHFDPLGLRASASYWGDDGLLESRDVGGAVYLRGEKGSASLEYQRRDFELTIDNVFLADPVTVDFDADGIGLSASFELNERIRAYLSGMDFDYSRDIRIQPNLDTLRFFSLSRLSIVNSLVDYRASAGLELSFGLRSLDFRLARWRTEVDQGEVDSFGIGFLMPAGDVADIEFRLAHDDSENFGGATVFSFFLYLYDD